MKSKNGCWYWDLRENDLIKIEISKFEIDVDTLKRENIVYQEQLGFLKKSTEELRMMWSAKVKSLR